MSGFIPRNFIDQLINQSDIVDIIQERVHLKKAGKNFTAPCPFHQEKTPSFNVSPVKQFYHCFGCGASGNIISFLMDYDRMEFPEAIEFLADRLGLNVPYEKGHSNQQASKASKLDDFSLMQEIANFYKTELAQSQDAKTYLEKRQIDPSINKVFQLGFAPNRWDSLLRAFPKNTQKLFELGMLTEKENRANYYDRFRHRLMFPIRNTRGQIIGFGGRVLDDSLPKYLNSPETPLFQKNRELYGWYECLQHSQKLQQVFVVEGYLDVIALFQAGITEAVATLGTATSSEHIQKITKQCQHIIFCFDGDRAGREAAWRALNAALPVLRDNLQIHFLFLPEGEDPDSFVRQFGAAKFREFGTSALPLSTYFYNQLSQECHLHTAEGRAKLVNLAIPLLAKIPPGAFLSILTQECARLSKMEHNKIQQLLHNTQINVTNFEPVSALSLQAFKLQLTPIRLAIALLLQNPILGQHSHAKTIVALQNDSPGTALLHKIYQQCLANPDFLTAHLLEMWRNEPECDALMKLAGQELSAHDEKTTEQLWQDTLRHLGEQHRQLQIDALIKKVKENTINTEEHQILMELLKNRS